MPRQHILEGVVVCMKPFLNFTGRKWMDLYLKSTSKKAYDCWNFGLYDPAYK
jgi:hypothetical protein